MVSLQSKDDKFFDGRAQKKSIIFAFQISDIFGALKPPPLEGRVVESGAAARSAEFFFKGFFFRDSTKKKSRQFFFIKNMKRGWMI